ncbi:MAG: MarR family transcriptional regulator, partial [Terracoccus sp.]
MAAKGRSIRDQHADDVATYVAAGGEETVQRVITAVYGVTKKLDQWYNRQFADLELSQGEWAVLAALAKAGDTCLTPSQLADLSSVAPSSMTHRLDKMTGRGILQRRPDE